MNGTRTRRWRWRDLALALLLTGVAAGVAAVGFLLGWQASRWGLG